MVEIHGLGKLLSEHPFFNGMADEPRETLAGCAANEVFKPNEFICKDGESANKIYLIRSGTVTIEVYVPGRPPVIVKTLHDGDIIGYSALVPPYMWTLDARASDQVRTISLDVQCMRGKIEADRVLGYELYKRFLPVMAQQLAEARLRIVELSTEPRPAVRLR